MQEPRWEWGKEVGQNRDYMGTDVAAALRYCEEETLAREVVVRFGALCTCVQGKNGGFDRGNRRDSAWAAPDPEEGTWIGWRAWSVLPIQLMDREMQLICGFVD